MKDSILWTMQCQAAVNALEKQCTCRNARYMLQFANHATRKARNHSKYSSFPGEGKMSNGHAANEKNYTILPSTSAPCVEAK